MPGYAMDDFGDSIRFLTDYLQGDVYFKTAYPEHNLVRARNQFALLKDMDRKTEQMAAVIRECLQHS